jgi:hypothetical protein
MINFLVLNILIKIFNHMKDLWRKILSYIKKCTIILLISITIFSVTNEFVYGISENITTNNTITGLVPIELDNNITNQGNTLETIINWIDPIIQSQANLIKDLTEKTNVKNNLYTNNTTNSNKNIKTTLDNRMVHSKFNEIQNIPYNEHSMNCEVKSKLFAEYLYSHGEKQVNLVVVEHSSGTYSHEFVEWNGHYYDTCNNNEQSYTVSEQDYLQQLRQLGFTGLIITSPYPN